MKAAIIFLALFALGITFAIKVDLREAFEQAEKELTAKVKRQAMNGATSDRFLRRKVIPLSREMARRNGIFRQISQNLYDEGLRQEVADKMAQQAMRMDAEMKKKMKKMTGHAGGQGGMTTSVDIFMMCKPDMKIKCDGSNKFRTYDAHCNNLEGSGFEGTAGMAFIRDVPVGEYDPKEITVHEELIPAVDQGKFKCKDKYGCAPRTNLPGPRLVSKTVVSKEDIPSERSTHFYVQFGQFQSHDVAFTPEEEVEGCCENKNQASCLPIDVKNDPFFRSEGLECLEFTRSVPFCEEQGGAREQLNGITAFVDASNIYGSDDKVGKMIRTGQQGLLKTENNFLPLIDGIEIAGDVRAREMPGLAAMHLIWVREHNRVAKILAKSFETDEEIFQHARRIVTAEYQNVVFSEYLQGALGDNDLKPTIQGTIYNPKVKAEITNEFATAVYRFGHSMLNGQVKVLALNAPSQLVKKYNLSDNFFDTELYYQGFENILEGLMHQEALNNDHAVTEQVSNFLFANVLGHGNDLVARNIQRGRDHGLPGFCCYYKRHVDSSFDCSGGWDKPMKDIPLDVWNKLKQVYHCPSDIDLFVGGIAQQARPGRGNLGEVFRSLFIDQFRRARDSDRFFFTHVGSNLKGVGFSAKARSIFIQRTMAGIMCDNTDLIKVKKNPFSIESKLIDCKDTFKIDESNIKALLNFV